MPFAPPSICPCGHKVPKGTLCACAEKRQAERKARIDKLRPTSTQRGYDGKWRAESREYLKANPVCARPGCNAPATHVDHIIPHRGDKKLFWRRSNWQGLCTHDHASWKQALECREVTP